jgi:hypothetical protein
LYACIISPTRNLCPDYFHPSWFVHLTTSYEAAHTVFSSLLLLRLRYSPQHPVRSIFFSSYKTTGNIIVMHNLIFTFLDRRRRDKSFWTEW